MFKNTRLKTTQKAGAFFLFLMCVMMIAACSLDPDLETLRDELINSQSFTVTFDKNGGVTEAAPAAVSVRKSAATVGTLPETEPTNDGYTFAGWNTRADGTGSAFLADTPVTENITVYAKWQPVSEGNFTVVFYSNGGTFVRPLVAASGDPVVTPSLPTKTGYIFDKWYADADLTSPYDFASPVTANIRLYAGWFAGYEVIADGETNVLASTKLIITLSAPAGELSADDITITPDTGSAVKGTLSGSGTVWTLQIDSVAQGDIKFKITKAGVDPAEKTVTVHEAEPALPVLQSIAVTTMPDKITYTEGETLDLTGLEITAAYDDASQAAVTDYTTTPAAGDTLTAADTTVTVSYTEGGVTQTKTFTITVDPVSA